MIYFFIVAALLGSISTIPSPIGSLFTVVQFPNAVCTTTESLVGTCMTSSECTTLVGTASGQCAAGFGVCCLVTEDTCSSSAVTISSNNTYIRNPSYPSTYPTSTSAVTCAFKISKVSSVDICQLRLDFQTLELGQTAATGVCTDSLAATLSAEGSVSTTNPSLCGIISGGQHMYLDLGATTTTTAEITISLAASSAAAKWNVLTRQIPCDPTYMAPTDCTQYLTGITGSISTYGYNSGIITTENLPSLDYKVCIRREDGYCSIRHSACSSTSFDLSAIANADTAIGVRGAVGCYADFIQIPGGSLDGTGTTYDRYCGGKLTHIAGAASQAIISKSVPFEVYVHTDVTDTPSATPYGVCLNYQQLPC